MTSNDSHTRNPSPLNVLSWPLLCLAMILTGIALFIPIHQLPWAWPVANGWNGATPLAIPLAMGAVVAGAVFALLAMRVAFRHARAGTFLEWISLHLLIFASIWIILPSSGGQRWIWPLGTTLIVGTAWLHMRSRKNWPSVCSRYFFSARNALPDSLMVLLPLLTGYWVSGGIHLAVESNRLLYSILLYSVYALFQLTVFLTIPATRMLKMGYSSPTIIIGCAVVFSLAHWPNPLLMAVTGIAMMVWASQFLKGRSILVLALIMGIAATGFRFMVPQQMSWDMRIGPDYIEKRSELTEY